MDRQRIDKWLWHARVVKTRADAAALVAKGRVRLNGMRQTSPGHAVKAGDVLTVTLDRRVRLMRVTGFAERRGDAAAAALTYADVQPIHADVQPIDD
ncbi:MAG: RNA-binding S4 domain-containing protein [Afipia sp.]|nr:RNA-binding S4 domain-containing protein [Afipia sp.]